ncbi:N-acetyltransferase [Enterococcus gallinarum]|nr:N-acetyltransferase [Enterococcus gallinarum]
MEIKEEKNRFALLDGEKEIGEMTWSNAGTKRMIIDHTFVDPAYRGQGLAEKLVAKGVEKARRKENNHSTLSICKKEFERKPEYSDVWSK